MVHEETGFIHPLCPRHHEAMISRPSSGQAQTNSLGMIETHGCQCPVDGCSQMYSLSLGYFSVGLNDDYWRTTRSPSLKIVRSGTPTPPLFGPTHRIDSLHFGVHSSNIPLWTEAPVPLHPTPRLQAPTQEPLNLIK